MLLNSRYNNFNFQFPKNFFYESIIKRYDPFFKRVPIPYTNLSDFMSYTVQSVSWPAISTEIAEQYKHSSKPVYKSGFGGERYMSKELTVTFRTVEGYLNYFVMNDMYLEYWKLFNENEKIFVPNLTLYLLDHYGYLLMTVHYKDVVYSGLSELELSYASNVPEFKTFTATFICGGLKFKRELQ